VVTSVVFLVPRAVTPWDEHRWGFEMLATKGIEVRALDLSLVLGKGRRAECGFEDPDRPETIERFAEFVRAAAPTSVFIDYLRGVSGPNIQTMPVFTALREANAVYYVVAGGSLPPAPIDGRRLLRVTARPWRVLRHIQWLFSRAYAERIGRYEAPRRIFGPPAPVVSDFATRHGIPADRLIPTHSLDYDVLYRADKTSTSADAACVFVDDGLAGHPDFAAPGRRAADAEPYFAALRHVFDRLEEVTEHPVVVAGHPRSEALQSSDVGGRRVIRGKTAELIAASVLVVGHASTALGFAALAHRPILLLSGRFVTQAGLSGGVAAMASALGAPVVDPEDEAMLAALGPDVGRVEEARRASYVANYVRASGTLEASVWEIVVRHAEEDLARVRTP
jgi:hypothetical protein